MATDNKSLGRFDLVGLPPAPRGVPQVEVTFDIDANGIVHVSAKDMATNKEQSIKITASSNLSKEEVERMQKEAEAHADEDKKKREEIEAVHEAESLVFQYEKTKKDLQGKVDTKQLESMDADVAELKKLIEADQKDTAKIKEQFEKTQKMFSDMSTKLYEQAAQAQQQASGKGNAQADESKDEKVVDAEYSVEDQEDKKSEEKK